MSFMDSSVHRPNLELGWVERKIKISRKVKSVLIRYSVTGEKAGRFVLAGSGTSSWDVMSQEDQPPKPALIHPTAYERGMTELHFAAYGNDAERVASLLSMGAAADARDDNGWTPLHWSIDMAQACGDPRLVVELLLQAGASPNAVDNSGYSVLMMACDRNNENILDQLLRAGADVRQRNSETTPLHEAAGANFHEAIPRLLAMGADPGAVNAAGRTPKQHARWIGFPHSYLALKRAERPAT
jgi:hypothetical protein